MYLYSVSLDMYIYAHIYMYLYALVWVWSLVLTTNRGVFIILSRTSDRAFLQIKISRLKSLTIFAEKLSHRCKQCVSV